MIIHSLTRLAVALMVCMGLAACGHNSNGNDHNDDEVRVDVQVMDGALANPSIFADLNRNHEWDADEPHATLGGDGKGMITVPKDLLKDSAGNMVTHFNIVSESSSGTNDNIFGSNTSLKSPVVMSREVFEGSSGIQSITPFTTLADMSFSPETVDTMTAEAYNSSLEEIAKFSGGGDAAVAGGYNDTLTDENLVAMIAGELLTRNGITPATLAALKAAYEDSSLGLSEITEKASKVKSDAEAMALNLKDRTHMDGRDVTGADVVAALEAYVPSSDNPESDNREPNKPEPNKPEPNKPEPNKPEPNKPEPNKPEPNDPEPNDPEPNKPER